MRLSYEIQSSFLTMLALNVISPFLAGFMIPGKPIGVMVFKVFSTITLGQAYARNATHKHQPLFNKPTHTLNRQYFCQDLKIAHYMKVPPRVTFMCQVVATIWACFVQIAVMNWTLGNIENVCASSVSSFLALFWIFHQKFLTVFDNIAIKRHISHALMDEHSSQIASPGVCCSLYNTACRQ